MKALSMIPSPTEIIAAFEKTLPPSVFLKLMTRVQQIAKDRQKDYFEKLSDQNRIVEYVLKSVKNDATGVISEYWAMRAKRDIEEGEEIVAESPDVAFPTLAGLEKNIVTKDYFGSSNLSFSLPGNFDLPSEVQNFLEDLTSRSNEAYQKLLDHCKKQGTSSPLLMLRYISVLLLLELQQQSKQAESLPEELVAFFAHYDHLRPAMRSPNDVDIKEATLIRNIFSKKNENFKDFLTNEIYSAMKYTLLFNSIAFSNGNDVSGTNEQPKGEYARQGGYLSNCDAFGVYHTIAHIDHSFEGNCKLEMVSKDELKIRVKATKRIPRSEPVAFSYLTPEDTINVDKRQLMLLQHFGMFVPTAPLNSN